MSQQPQSAPTMGTGQAPTAAATAPVKTVRYRANPTQGAVLMASFTACQHADDAALERLERDTGLPKKYISGWFGRQRQKARKNQEKLQAISATGSARPGMLPAEGSSTSLEVKEEACDTVMISQDAPGAVPAVGKKKRQRQTQAKCNVPSNQKKKRKANAVPEEHSNAPKVTTAGAHNSAIPASSAPPSFCVLPTLGNAQSSTGHESGIGLARTASSLLFNKIQVKMERYTPPPGELISSNTTAPLGAGTGHGTAPNVRRAQIIRPRSIVAEALNNPKSSGERLRAIPNTAVSKGRSAQRAQNSAPYRNAVQASMPARMTSPSDVAMKGRRQRDMPAGEGPVTRSTPWQARSMEQSRAQDSGSVTGSSGVQVITATNFDYENAQAYQAFSRLPQTAPSQTVAHPVRLCVPPFSPAPLMYPNSMQAHYSRPTVLKAPTPPPLHPRHRVQASYSASAIDMSTQHPPLSSTYQSYLQTSGVASSTSVDAVFRSSSRPPVDPIALQTSYYGTPASFHPPTPACYSFGLPLQNSRRATLADYDAPSPWNSPQIYAAPMAHDAEMEWLRGFNEHLENAPQYDAMSCVPTQAPDSGYSEVGYLDPLHAPLKHLTEIVSPLCDSLGISYNELATLNGEQKHVVMEKLLDEDMGERDPFKAAMGLVMASKLGLRWD